MSEHEIIIPGREAVALSLANEMMARNLEAPKTSEELLRLFCRCLVAVRDPERTLVQVGTKSAHETASADQVETVDNAPGSF